MNASHVMCDDVSEFTDEDSTLPDPDGNEFPVIDMGGACLLRRRVGQGG